MSFEIETKRDVIIQFSEERKHKLLQRGKLFLGTGFIPCSFISGAVDNLVDSARNCSFSKGLQ